jgi:hypothetical protein
LFTGLTVEGIILSGGAIYLLATGMYLRPVPWVALVVVASVLGVVVGVVSYLGAGKTRD